MAGSRLIISSMLCAAAAEAVAKDQIDTRTIAGILIAPPSRSKDHATVDELEEPQASMQPGLNQGDNRVDQLAYPL
jgi:hypothetical protein